MVLEVCVVPASVNDGRFISPFCFVWRLFMAKFRTIAKALEEVKKIDPDTCLSDYVLRRLASEEKISQIQSGNKTLIEVESLLDFLNGEENQERS